MAGPEDIVGRVEGELRFTTDKASRDVRQGLEEAGRVGDKEMAQIGKDWSVTLDKEVKKGTTNTGRDLARSIVNGLEREGIKATKIIPQFDTDGNLIRRWAESEIAKGEKVVEQLASSGAFNKIGTLFRDAIGAGFNISGKSPLIALLVPVIGAIVELVGAAIQAASGLVAALTTVPNLIGAIVLQVGVLYLAFHGLGGAIQAAFAAKNADELKKAIENLTPAAQDFVKSLLPLKDLFQYLSSTAQQNFFASFGNSIAVVQKAIGPILGQNIGALAEHLGLLGRTLVTFLADPVFTRFLNELIPATIRWIDQFGPALDMFLVGMANLGHAVMPFFEWLGQQLNTTLARFGEWLSNLSVDPDFLAWLEQMKGTLKDTGTVLLSILGLVKAFASSLNKAGGDTFLKNLAEQLDELSKFLESDVGRKTFQGLIFLAVELTQILIGLFFTVGFLVASVREFFLFLSQEVFPLFTSFYQWVQDKVQAVARILAGSSKEWLADFMALGTQFIGFFTGVGDQIGSFVSNGIDSITFFFSNLQTSLGMIADGIKTWFVDRFNDVVAWAQSIPGAIQDGLGDLLGLLEGAGKNVIRGLINGAKSMLQPLKDAFDWLMQEGIVRFLPHSPAEIGPLSGRGDPMIAGQTIVDRIATGMEMQAPDLRSATTEATSNILMGTGAVQMNFYGPTPTTQQAGAVGAAAGNSLANVLAARNTHLAVRTA